MIYLDYNATAPMKPAVTKAILEAMERHGNPSSVHRYGRIARRYVEEARAAVSALAGVKPAQVIFTSGGTEANNMALRGVKAASTIVSSIEHDAVLAAAPDAIKIPVARNGVIDCYTAEKIIKSAPAGSLVSVMLVNNETGIIQPVAEIARMAKAAGHIVHTDAVQAAGRLPIDFNSLGVDMLTLSAHKIGGPQGMGALVVGEKLAVQSLIKGGGQEMNRRAGTENVPGIIGFGIASRLAVDDLREMPRIAQWRDALGARLQKIAGKDAEIVGSDSPRIANTLSVVMRGVSSETQVMAMDLAGVAVSAGAACTSGKVKSSHVLRAMGYGEDVAGAALRISLGWNTALADLDHAVEAWRGFYGRTRSNRQSQAA